MESVFSYLYHHDAPHDGVLWTTKKTKLSSNFLSSQFQVHCVCSLHFFLLQLQLQFQVSSFLTELHRATTAPTPMKVFFFFYLDLHFYLARRLLFKVKTCFTNFTFKVLWDSCNLVIKKLSTTLPSSDWLLIRFRPHKAESLSCVVCDTFRCWIISSSHHKSQIASCIFLVRCLAGCIRSSGEDWWNLRQTFIHMLNAEPWWSSL